MADMMYRLILKAKFEDEAELQRALQGISQLDIAGANVTVRAGAMGRAGRTNLEGIASSALRCGFMLNMLESSFMRAEMAQMRMARGQHRYNEIVKKYGKNSEEAKRAMKELELQTSYLNRANMRVNISTGLMLLQLALQSGLLKQATLAQLAHTGATIIATAKDWLHVAALAVKAKLIAMTTLGAAVPAMLIGAGLVSAAIAGYTYAGRTPTSTSQINIKTDVHVETNVEDALRESNKEVVSELRRMQGG